MKAERKDPIFLPNSREPIVEEGWCSLFFRLSIHKEFVTERLVIVPLAYYYRITGYLFVERFVSEWMQPARVARRGER